jgi:Radical SAM superfamily/4Fe-4S single cluster domain/Iron-sulfur cluster-binding domain
MGTASTQPTIAPTILALHLTYKCPLHCAHCCVDAGPTKRTELQAEQIRSLIRQAALDCKVEGIGVTGGDPFIVPELVTLAMTEAKSYNLKTHLVTSAYWAKSIQDAGERIDAITRGNLDELCISFDDSHARYVKFERIGFAYRAAMIRGIKVRFLISVEPGSVIDIAWMREKIENLDNYDAGLTTFTSGAVVSTGRAFDTSTVETRASRASSHDKYLGPCPIVFRRLAVNPDGNILACCGTVPFYSDLCIGNVNTHTLSQAVESMYKNRLLKWIAFEGPVDILKTVTSSDTNPLTDANFEGICQACDLLFSNPTLRARAYAAADEQVDRIALEELIFRSVGHFPEFASASNIVSSQNNQGGSR